MADLDQLRPLRTFAVVAETGSITRAAEILDYAQSSVTAQIRQLELSLGTDLLKRMRRGVTLTPAGTALLGTLGPLFRAVRDAEASVSSRSASIHGTIEIAVSESLLDFALPSLLATFREALPDVRPTFCSAGTFGLRKPLIRNADLAIVLSGELDDDTVEHDVIGYATLVGVRSPAHPEVRRPVLATCSVRPLFEAMPPDDWHEYDSARAILRCVEHGLGIGIVPRFEIESELRDGRLVLDEEVDPVAVTIRRVRSVDRSRTAAAAAAWQVIAGALNGLL